MTYKFLPHTADVKVEVTSKKFEQAFTDSAKAITETITQNQKIQPKIQKKISIQGKDLKSLLYNFLEEFLFLLDAKNFLLSEIRNIKVDKDKFTLEANITGDDADKYEFSNDVKAITYSDMFIQGKKQEIKMQFVLDV